MLFVVDSKSHPCHGRDFLADIHMTNDISFVILLVVSIVRVIIIVVVVVVVVLVVIVIMIVVCIVNTNKI